jgi:hypothetical protein
LAILPVYVRPPALPILGAVDASPAANIATAAAASFASTAAATESAPPCRVDVIHITVVGIAVPASEITLKYIYSCVYDENVYIVIG